MCLAILTAEGRRSAHRQLPCCLEVVAVDIKRQKLEDASELSFGIFHQVLVAHDPPATRSPRLGLLETANRPRRLRPFATTALEIPVRRQRPRRRMHDRAPVTDQNQQPRRREEREKTIETSDTRGFRDQPPIRIYPEKREQAISEVCKQLLG